MSQHALTIANQAGASFRSDVVNALQALGTKMSGASAPATTYAYMPWADTTSGWLKQRNAANSAWIFISPLAGHAEAGVASATTTDLGAQTSDLVLISGTTTITGFGTADAGRCVKVRHSGALILTHNGTSLILPGAANITTAAGDTYEAESLGSGNWVVRAYQKASGAAVVGATAAGSINGLTRNGKMSVTTASATGTYTADEIVVETALGGTPQQLASYSQAINLATTGAGGMDTGTAPVSGFVSLYAIAKTDGTKNILACAVATSSGSIYSGGNMPAGYTLSALLGIWPTNGSSQFLPGLLMDRHFDYQAFKSIFTGQNSAASLTSQSISTSVPAAARKVDICFAMSTTTINSIFNVASDGTGTGAQMALTAGAAARAVAGLASTYLAAQVFKGIPIITSQTVYWMEASANTNTQNNMFVAGYEV